MVSSHFSICLSLAIQGLISPFFIKPLDKIWNIWYNIIVQKDAQQLFKEINKNAKEKR